jgi:general secretion pathway protein E
MPWATQLQINAAQGVTFSPALRSVMRQDPDVIFVGEIRDKETMLGCVQAALTGHLVLTTLHAADAVKAVFRIREMGIEPFLIASALVGVVAERLVRKVCPDCGEPAPLANGSRAKVTAQAAAGGFSLPAKARFQKGKGCKTCFGSGYRGRTGVFEILEFTAALKDSFLKGADEQSLRQAAVREGTTSLTGDGIRKAAEGITSMEEILRVFSAD